MARHAVSWVSAATENGGGSWASDSVSWRAAPSGLLVAAHRTVPRTAGANGAKRTAAPSSILAVEGG
jgi:hypothetical protein